MHDEGRFFPESPMQAESAFSTPEEDSRRIAFTLKEAARASGISRSLLYVAIGRGELRARKCGARTVILDSDLRRFLNRLPRFGGRTSAGATGPQKRRRT
jgi:hypothetical protein